MKNNPETQFTLKFAKTYIKQFNRLHYKSPKTLITLAREIPVNGLGIADFVAIAWDSNKSNPTIRAFELKLSNWRKALKQASRYKYFSSSSIIVLPNNKCRIPLQFIDTFKKIKIGLWGFDTNSLRIFNYYTPKPNKPKNLKYFNFVTESITNISKFQPTP